MWGQASLFQYGLAIVHLYILPLTVKRELTKSPGSALAPVSNPTLSVYQWWAPPFCLSAPTVYISSFWIFLNQTLCSTLFILPLLNSWDRKGGTFLPSPVASSLLVEKQASSPRNTSRGQTFLPAGELSHPGCLWLVLSKPKEKIKEFRLGLKRTIFLQDYYLSSNQILNIKS